MSLTNGQKKALHSAARQAGLSDEHRHMVQRSIGGFDSAKAAGWTRQGFIRVMAYFEKAAGGALRGCTAWYWRGEAGPEHADDALRHAIRQAAAGLPEPMSPEQLDHFLARMSNGNSLAVEGASRYWLSKLLDGLRALSRRKRLELAAELGGVEAAECTAAAMTKATAETVHEEEGGECDEEVPF